MHTHSVDEAILRLDEAVHRERIRVVLGEEKARSVAMSKTAVQAGRAIAFYTDDGQGRRLSIGARNGNVVEHPVIIATTKAEAVEAIAALRSLMEELPGDLTRAVSVSDRSGVTPRRSPRS